MTEDRGVMDEWGRCDTCGSPCDEQGCATDRDHEIALDGLKHPTGSLRV